MLRYARSSTTRRVGQSRASSVLMDSYMSEYPKGQQMSTAAWTGLDGWTSLLCNPTISSPKSSERAETSTAHAACSSRWNTAEEKNMTAIGWRGVGVGFLSGLLAMVIGHGTR